MNKPGRLPPFKNGLRVVPYGSGSATKWRIDAREGIDHRAGVDVAGLEDDVLVPALKVLNKMAKWRALPFTPEAVRALAEEWEWA